jgi:hypothetical protein
MAKKTKGASKPLSLTPLQALQLLEPHFGRFKAKLLIADALRDGLIHAEAKESWESSKRDAWAEFENGPPEDGVISPRRMIPRLWCSSSSWLADVAQWRWKPGYFYITLQERPLRRLYLKRLRFPQDQIAQLLPRKAKSNRGRPMRVEDWKLVGPALVRMALQGRFTPESTRALVDGFEHDHPFRGSEDIAISLSAEIADSLKEGSFRPMAAELWKEFLDPQKFEA